MEKWILKNPKVNIKKLVEESGVSELLCRILANRQVVDPDSVRAMVRDQMPTADGFCMKDMKKAVDLIAKAISGQKQIRIISDYDVDGVMSATILCDALRQLGAHVDVHIPHRITDGYGINENIVDAAIADQVDLIITCDNGISAMEPMKKAKAAGLEVIITDHHEVPFIEEAGNAKGAENTGVAGAAERTYLLPPADAILDPKQADCMYPFKKLCGAGVVYKLIECLLAELSSEERGNGKDGFFDPSVYLELVAIATVCDVVDLVGENRELLKRGLAHMRDAQNIGLKALIAETGLLDKKLGVYHLGFVLGPCINASGRLEDAQKAVELFMTENEGRATEIAAELVALNEQRKGMTREGIEQVIRLVEDGMRHQEDKVIVAYCPAVSESIAGIVAGRVRERFSLPAIVLTDGESEVKGSGRSIEEYNLFEQIQKCGDLLIRFGGHPMAAGLSLKKENVEAFTEKIKTICPLTEDDITVKVRIDLNLDLEKINMSVAEELALLEPYGKGNEKPLFGTRHVVISSMIPRGAEQNVLSMKLKQSSGGRTLDAVFFGNFNIKELKTYEMVDIAYHIDINEYNGKRSVRLVVDHIRESI